MHSVTKYLNGHADVILGALITNNEEIYNKLLLLQYCNYYFIIIRVFNSNFILILKQSVQCLHHLTAI